MYSITTPISLWNIYTSYSFQHLSFLFPLSLLHLFSSPGLFHFDGGYVLWQFWSGNVGGDECHVICCGLLVLLSFSLSISPGPLLSLLPFMCFLCLFRWLVCGLGSVIEPICHSLPMGLNPAFAFLHLSCVFACMCFLLVCVCLCLFFTVYHSASFIVYTLVFHSPNASPHYFSPIRQRRFTWVTLNTQQTTPSHPCAFVADLLADFCWHFSVSKQFW